MARRDAAPSRVERLTRELLWIRWRGLESIEVHNSHQYVHATPETDHLARQLCAARGLVLDDRIAEIRLLLRYGIAAYWLKGNRRAALRFRRLYFDPAESVPPQTPRKVLQDLKAEMERAGQDYAAWRRIAFPHWAAFLIEFVDVAVREAEALPPKAVVAVTPTPETPPRLRLGCARLVLTGLAILVIAGVVVARLLGAAAAPQQATMAASAKAMIVAGTVECSPDPTKAVVGVWIVGSNGGSGWAHWHALPGYPNIALFSYTLPHGGSYVIHAGCGGTPQHWELALDSVTPVLGSSYRFSCFDSTAYQSPYQGQCQP